MGSGPSDGGYKRIATGTPMQSSALDQLLQMGLANQQGAAQGFKQFLPGGGGGDAIANAAQSRFQQQTIPSILNAFGSGSKGSSALNQALAAGGANLNSDIMSQLAQMQLQAASGLGNIGASQSALGQSPQFAYLQRQLPFWQQALLGGTQAASQLGSGFLGGLR